ncbi:uncharacterized protein BXZ73DRAFT_43205, partial [Epithele typhae]|uniref:uncharacterized protein n=1 Tax=Epithele typhae TaxID=378194 RepID=UPI0020072529
TEPQSVAGRWRALTRTHVKALLETGEAQTQRLFDTLAAVVLDVLVGGGGAGSREEAAAALAAHFERALYDVVSLALEFQWTAGERIVSRDFVVFVVEDGAPFNPGAMEEDGALGPTWRQGEERQVIATVGLGMRMEVKVDGDKLKDVPGEVRRTTMVKPAVILGD